MKIFLLGAALSLLPLILIGAALPDQAPAPDAWQRAIGARDWQFPRDHGAHPAFKTEWWYFTGNLHQVDQPSRTFGYELTLFRQGLQFTPAQTSSRWAIRDFFFGNLAISDIAANQFHFHERVSRGALGEAHSAENRMDVAVGPWSILQSGEKEGEVSYRLKATERDMTLDLEVRPAKPLVLEGVQGLSQKAPGPGQASYYYSYPLLTTTGTLATEGHSYNVAGQSWFDHEFSTSVLAKNQVGWDWFCLQFSSGEEAMLYVMRENNGGISANSQGTWIHRDGTTEPLASTDFQVKKLAEWTSPKSQATYPAHWQVTIPKHQADIRVTPALADQELVFTENGTPAYWEGAVKMSGSLGSGSAGGVGYVELTGYAQKLNSGLQEQ